MLVGVVEVTSRSVGASETGLGDTRQIFISLIVEEMCTGRNKEHINQI